MNHTGISATTIARFMRKVDSSGECWTWLGATGEKGYGRFSIGGSHKADGSRRNSMVAAHRFSYAAFVGPIPSGYGYHGTCVLHRCDNPRCVRPEHLFLGTNADNVHDMDRKGRRVNGQLRGSSHHAAVLTEEKVREIVRLHRVHGITQAQLSRDFGVCTSTVNHIFTGRLWRHLGVANSTRNAQ